MPLFVKDRWRAHVRRNCAQTGKANVLSGLTESSHEGRFPEDKYTYMTNLDGRLIILIFEGKVNSWYPYIGE
jgi:hypothetical protein